MSSNVPRVAVAAEGPRLRVGQGLQFKLAVLFVIVTLILGIAAWQIGRVLVQSNLVSDTQRYQRESGLRLVQEIEARLEQSRVLASTLAELGASGEPRSWTARVPALVAGSGLGDLIAGVGWWPEPASRSAPRESRYWLASAAGALQSREDYNDPRAIAYWQEPWYTPARYAASGACVWSVVHAERLSQRRVVGCTLPLRDAKGFRGAVTVLLAVEGLDELLRKVSNGQSGYALLADRDNRLMAMTGLAAAKLADDPPRNLAELAKRLPPFNTLALELHQRDETFLSRSVQSPLYDAALISALKDGTRDASRQEAESVLALIWNAGASGASKTPDAESLAELRIRDDALIEQDASATVFELPGPYWKLIRVTSAREGVAGAQYFFTQTLVVVVGSVVVTLLLIYAGVRMLILRPLARMATRLSDARTLEESIHLQLEARSRNELGVIGHWYNERVRQLREAMDRAMTHQSQLIVESGERARADEQSLRLRERSQAISTSVADAAITVDARGLIEDMNAPAERLTNVVLRIARGKPCGEVLHLRLANQGGVAPDFAASVVASSSRIEHSDGLFLHVEGRSEREIQLIGSPLRGPGGRSLGAVLVFRPREAASTGAPGRLVIDRRSVDPVTGLPTRPACDRRLRALLESAKLQLRTHALIVGDVDRLRHVNETLGLQAGDEVLVRVAETLVSVTPGADVFRLGADSFAMVLEGTDETDARRIGRLLCDSLAATQFQWADKKISVTASFGLVLFDGGIEHPMELLRRAEDACAAAKAAGRNTLRRYETSMNRRESAADQGLWVRRIRAGLDEGLLHLTTQAMQCADSFAREGAAFEVSLALEDEEGFWAEPATFLPIAERTGLVAEVERWAITQTFEHLARSPAALERLAFCCLPLSPQTVSEGATLELIAHQFQAHAGMPASKLCFVLREATLSEAPGPSHTFCEAMRSLGCRVAIDHFMARGVGAIDLLRRLPAEFIRIDARHFVDVAGDAVDQAIADSMIRLARTLQRRVIVAEIGDDSARDTWKRMGADYLQGLSIARPSPVVFTTNG